MSETPLAPMIEAFFQAHPDEIPPDDGFLCQTCGKPVPERREYLTGDADPQCDECWAKDRAL